MNKFVLGYILGLALILVCGTAMSQGSLQDDGPLSPYQKEFDQTSVRDTESHDPGSAVFNSGIHDYDDLGQEGSIFYDRGWLDGQVALASGEIIKPDKLCYNIYYQQMQFIKDGDTLAFAEPRELQWLQLGEERFIYADFLDGSELSGDFFQVLNEGPCKLLKRHVVTYHKAIDPNLNSQATDQFFKTCELYLKKEGMPAEKIRCSKKNLCEALGDSEEMMKEFIRENNLKMRSIEDMVTALNFYNTASISD